MNDSMTTVVALVVSPLLQAIDSGPGEATIRNHGMMGVKTYSAAIWRGAGGGLARSAISCACRACASFTAFSFTGP
jgi:hypothetical protein